MRRFHFDDAETTKVALRQEIARSPESRHDHCLHGLLLLCRGVTSYEVGEILGHSHPTIQYWYRRFQEGGFAGPTDAEGRGRRSSLYDPRWTQLAQDLSKSPETFGYSRGQWDKIPFSYHVKQAFGLDLGTLQYQTDLSQDGVPTTQTTWGDCRGRSRGSEGIEKNSIDGSTGRTSIFGVWMSAIFNSRFLVCCVGFPRRRRTRSSGTHRHENK
jgi:transposase